MLSTINDPRPGMYRKIESITAEIEKLEALVDKEWQEIKDFVHSYEKTDAAQKRIANIKANIRKLITERGKIKSKLTALDQIYG